MGQLCTSHESARGSDEKISDQEIDAKMRESNVEQRKTYKLLLLGAGASGKSTIFKQMVTLYGEGFTDVDMKGYTGVIYANVLSSMKGLCKCSSKFGDVLPENKEAKSMLEDELKLEEMDVIITWSLGQDIKKLWLDPVIQKTWEDQTHRAGESTSAKYFFDRIDEISKTGYVPTEQDILRVRVPTTGIVESIFTVDGNEFKLIDVGGQRNERRKWIHCFDNVTAVLFVVALSEYHQVLYEDETRNRLVESLILFDDICNCKFLKGASMILFLNKRDLFAESIEKYELPDFFKEYTGPSTYEAGVAWIQQQFDSKNQQKDKPIYFHVTCATDKNCVQAVFTAVKDTIIRTNLSLISKEDVLL